MNIAALLPQLARLQTLLTHLVPTTLHHLNVVQLLSRDYAQCAISPTLKLNDTTPTTTVVNNFIVVQYSLVVN